MSINKYLFVQIAVKKWRWRP